MVRTMTLALLLGAAGAGCRGCGLSPSPDGGRPDSGAFDASADAVELHIDDVQASTELAGALRAGTWLSVTPSNDKPYITQKYFKENVPGQIQLQLPIGGTQNFEAWTQSLRNAFAVGSYGRVIIDETKKSGALLVVGVWPYAMPRWLSSRAGDARPYRDGNPFKIESVSPPKCFLGRCTQMSEITCQTAECTTTAQADLAARGYVLGWTAVVDHALRFLRTELGVSNLAWYEGHEQTLDWIGAEEDFFKVYKAAVTAAKSIDPTIRVGGVGATAWDVKREPCRPEAFSAVGLQLCRSISGWSYNGEDCKDPAQGASPACKPMNQNLLHYARANGLPVDFLNFHMFSASPVVSDLGEAASSMRSWLLDAGFPSDTPLYPADWTRWANAYPADYLDTEETAAYAARTTMMMAQAGIAWHSYDFSVTDQALERDVVAQRGREAQFIGDWAVFSRAQVIKPVYNAFRVISRLAGQPESSVARELRVRMVDDDFVIGTASRSGNMVRVLLANFVPGGRLRLAYALGMGRTCLGAQGYAESDIRTVVLALKAATSIIPPPRGPITSDYVSQLVDKAQLPTSLDSIDSRDDIKQCFKEALDLVNRRSQEPRQVRLSLGGLADGGYPSGGFLIDRNHSNACRLNLRTEPRQSGTECGIGGEVDRRAAQASAEAATVRLRTMAAALGAQGYSSGDLATLKSVLEACGTSDLSCLRTRLEGAWMALDRCQTGGGFDSNKCADIGVVEGELAAALKDAKVPYEQTLIYGSADGIDRINSSTGVALEPLPETTLFSDRGSVRTVVMMEPNSVMLFELRTQ